MASHVTTYKVKKSLVRTEKLFFALYREAKAMVSATYFSDSAKNDVYSLPNSFAFAINLPQGKRIRFVKECDVLRVLKSAEIAEVLLTFSFNDAQSAKHVLSHKISFSQALASGRISINGTPAFANAIIRIIRIADSIILSKKAYAKLYFSEKPTLLLAEMPANLVKARIKATLL